jgi:hypothetical protein
MKYSVIIKGPYTTGMIDCETVRAANKIFDRAITFPELTCVTILRDGNFAKEWNRPFGKDRANIAPPIDITATARALRAIPSAKRTAQSRANGAKGGRPYAWRLVRKISGIPVSRHATPEAASKAVAKWAQPERDPLELREYNAGYWAEMHV